MTSSVPAASVPPKPPARGSDRFVAYVHTLCESNGTRADLRRGLGLPVERCNYLHRYLVPWLTKRTDPDHKVHPDAKRAHYAVAALIAARPRSARDTPPAGATDDAPAVDWYQRANLGAAFAQAVTKGVMKPGTAESTLHLMCRQSAEAIHPGLPALTRRLLNGRIPVDWAVLLEDLSFWNRYRDKVATRWLESYFRTTSAEPADDSNPSSATPDTFEETVR
ncbi:type I-E CRISPR-associated protein Cse2/CasB [Streptomyces minutiscleroticus]|uniref:type I-E CRISPR-associated protein Cse2/CasB n=1 Tax=Streptomyces minutiscleroticus TaxID=68238 RepID=UPI00332F4140